MELDRTCGIDIKGLIIALVWFFPFCSEFCCLNRILLWYNSIYIDGLLGGTPQVYR